MSARHQKQSHLPDFFKALPPGRSKSSPRTVVPKYPLATTQLKKNVGPAGRDAQFVIGSLKAWDESKDVYTVAWSNNDHHFLETLTPAQVEWHRHLAQTVGTNIAKWFITDNDGGEQALFTGTVVDVRPDDEQDDEYLYYIVYEDDDEEEMEKLPYRQARNLYQQHSKKHKSLPTNKLAAAQKMDDENREDGDAPEAAGSHKRRRGTVRYKESSSDNDDEEEDAPPVAKSQESAKKKRKTSIFEDDDDDFSMADAAEEDEILQADSSEEDLVVENDLSDDDMVQKSKARGGTKKPAAKKAKAAPKEKSTGKDVDKQDEFHKKLEKDRKGFKPNNNPQKWPANGDFVDPVGVDPTHGIVEGIIAAQVRKVGGLLQLVMAEEKSGKSSSLLGELGFPIRLQTACSGTDAPSIGLGLIKENMDILCPGHSFDFSHEMSCEIEPFKQAYIARNFPGVPLFPDITKLTASEQVLDVYGRPQTIPDGNLFVAGTSCKDFSMLKTSYRLDIEDKGTSGETFLAAVEFLEQKQPRVAIFENVDGAPWSKMQEYITGRVDLKNRNITKAIKDASKKADADNELKFSVNSEGRYVAEVVPRQVGIRAGSVVLGFVREDHDPNDIEELRSDDKVKGMLSLGQLARKHKINLEADTLVMEKKARYCTHLCKLDTKDYGLPQTRNRKYLFIWRSDKPDDDLGEYFQDIMDHLKTPLLHSMDAFLLPDTHDRIRCFREALRSGPGLMVKRERAKELDFWDWDLAHVKDLTLHLVFREKCGIAERMRWLTGWDTRGRKKIAPGLWPELVDCWNMRRLDMVDCFSVAAIRDAISRDPMHHSFTWDLSQNVTRAPFRSATCGVSGCVTPGGELILPYKGRTVMGYEKLLLQGIPFSRLRLGPETEVQLSDLAGNAMSVPVVCATMLAAMCAPQLRRQKEINKHVVLSNFSLSQKYDAAGGAVMAERGDLYNQERDVNAKNFVDLFSDVAKKLARDAYRSSVLCTCESSGTTTTDPQILHCTQCGMGVCHECSGRYQVSTHVLEEIDVHEIGGRPDPHEFERKLRCAVPSILRLGSGWEGILKNGHGLESYSFQLQEVVRKRGHWTLLYGAWEDHGRGRQVAEIRVNVGRTGTLDSNYGVAASIRCFAPAIRHEKPFRGRLKDSARLIFNSETAQASGLRWQIPEKPSKCTLELVGSDEAPSQRVMAGLNNEAAKSLKAHNVAKSFLPPVNSRNSLTSYNKNWKTWPGKIVVSGDPSDRVNGTYRKMSCTHTVVLSALWRREDVEGKATMYLYFRPDVLRTKLDVAVFSTTPSYKDNMEICELHDWIPENALDEKRQKTKATFLEWKQIPDEFKVEVPQPSMFMVSQSESFHDRVCHERKHESSPPVLCEMGGMSKELISSLLEYNESSGVCDSVAIDLFGKSGTRNAKRLSIIAAPSLLKCAAEDKLPLTLSKWYRLPADSCVGFGQCGRNVPRRPVEKWQKRLDRDGTHERVYDPEESKEYYQQLFNRPSAFEVSVEKAKGMLLVRMDPYVAAHRAAAQLGGDSAASISVDYCMSELSSMGEPPTKEFHVPNSDAYDPDAVEGLVLPLYKRQAKALSRMKSIERGEVLFSEEERSEIVLPGIGWALIARASRRSPLRGGVLGDAIGSGKTVVTIALILDGVEKARKNRDIEKGRSSATLIVVPPGLVKQWDEERVKFTEDKLKCITIDCTSTLKRYSVADLCTADMVIVPAGLIEEAQGSRRPYTELLSSKAKAGKIPPAPARYSQREAPTIEGTWVRNMASGPEIYVGNRGNQRTRDAQAYYGHCYSEAISKLREKTFSASERGVPIEYFQWERVVIDEAHETLVTGKAHETKDTDFQEKARRGAREFLGVSETNIAKRPLRAATGVWGLTGTPLLETEARVTELANLMGGTYLTGAAHHWRKEERESGRDLFLNQQEATRSREYRCAVQEACHSYVREACQRNRGESLQVKLSKKMVHVNMSEAEGKTFLANTSDINLESFAITPHQLGEKAGDILTLTASSKARHAALLESIDDILGEEPETKIIIFANSSYGGYDSAREALSAAGKKACHITDTCSVQEQNEIISWFRHVDVTEEEKSRPRVLLLSFEQAAGHNLQEACHNVILYDPYYSGSDAVADASVEEQAIGRVMRQGQKYDVTVTRIILKGPKGERCLDDWIVERNLDPETLQAATSNFD